MESHRQRRRVFDYLAAEVFSRLSDWLQEFLLETSCLELISRAGCGTCDRQTRRTVDSRAAGPGQRLHHVSACREYLPVPSLFRSFLQNRARQHDGGAFQQSLLVRAARALADGGDVEAAIGLYLQSDRSEAAADLVERMAAEVVSQARLQTLAGWIDALPAPLVEGRAWLTYWRGIHQFTTSFMESRGTLERAHAAFCRNAEPLGQMLCCAAILRHISFSYADYRPMLPWIERLSALFKTDPSFFSFGRRRTADHGGIAAVDRHSHSESS